MLAQLVVTPSWKIRNYRSQIDCGIAHQVAQELDWPDDWFNEGAKGCLVGMSTGPIIFSAPGVTGKQPAVAQLLAMKLSAWRDDVDIRDAEVLLQTLLDEGASTATQNEVWAAVEPYLTPGDELKARYAFLDLWESRHDQN